MEHPELLAVCGLYCGACPAYQRRNRAGEEGPVCEGCLSRSLREECKNCAFKTCAEKKKISHCGLCDEFPCRALLDFEGDGLLHHLGITASLQTRKSEGDEVWLSQVSARFTCECGEPYTWYQETCLSCGKTLNSLGKDPMK